MILGVPSPITTENVSDWSTGASSDICLTHGSAAISSLAMFASKSYEGLLTSAECLPFRFRMKQIAKRTDEMAMSATSPARK